VKLDNSLSGVIEEFSKGYYHSAAVRDDSGLVINVIAQWDVANFLLRNSTLIHSLLNVTIEQMYPKYLEGTRDVISVTENTCVMDALKLICDKKISAVAVVDKNNNFVGNFSASNIKSLYDPWDFRMLSDKVKPFLEFTAQRHPSGIVTSSPTSTIQRVLEIMSKERVHRVYVAEAKSRITDVVTLTDILDNLVKSTSQPNTLSRSQQQAL